MNDTCKYGWSGLHYASKRGHDHIVELLLSYGARIHAPPGGQSPLDMASKSSTRTKLEADLLSGMMGGFSL